MRDGRGLVLTKLQSMMASLLNKECQIEIHAQRIQEWKQRTFLLTLGIVSVSNSTSKSELLRAFLQMEKLAFT